MAQSPDHSGGDGDEAESGTAKPHDSKAIDKNLPMVVAPKLGAGEDDAIDESMDDSADQPAAETAAAAASGPATRFLVLAASVAFAAAFGSFIGSVSGSGLARFIYPGEPAAGMANTSDAMHEMKLNLAALSVIKSDLDSAGRNATSQFAKIADRLDKLDRSAMTSETTGSIAGAATTSTAPGTTDVAKSTDRILPDWVVQDVQNGRALVVSRYGGAFDVGAGSTLPGVGRVDAIKRQDGQWLVLTERGTIASGR